MTVLLHKPEEDIMSLLLNKRGYKYISAFVQKLMLLLHVDDKYTTSI